MLGPSNVRDFGGLRHGSVIASTVPPQSIITDWVYFNPMIYVLYAVDLRRNVNFRYFGSGSPFEYDLVASSTPRSASSSCASAPRPRRRRLPPFPGVQDPMPGSGASGAAGRPRA